MPTLNPYQPVLYLDFDGVLHPDAVYLVRGQIVLKADGFSLFEWAPVLYEQLGPYPSIQLVLSTSWVKVLGYDIAIGYLPIELQQRVVDATWSPAIRPARWERHMTRYMQIAEHASRHHVRRWIAVDDDIEGWSSEHVPRLVATEPELGLGDIRAQRLLAERLAWLAGASS